MKTHKLSSVYCDKFNWHPYKVSQQMMEPAAISAQTLFFLISYSTLTDAVGIWFYPLTTQLFCAGK